MINLIKTSCTRGFLKNILAVVLGLSTSVVGANGLYTATVDVSDQSAQKRAEATELGLLEVVQKVTGVFDDLQLKPAMEQLSAKALLQSYTYQKNTDQTQNPYVVSLSYDSKALNKQLLAQGLPVLDSNRPKTIIWLALQDEDTRDLISQYSLQTGETFKQLAQQVPQIAAEYGIPVVLPVLDLEDIQAVSVTDVWGKFQTPVIEASKRYDAQAVVSAKIYQHADGRWLGQWTLIGQGQDRSWQTQGFELKANIKQAFTELAQLLSKRYGVSASKDKHTELLLDIDNVQDVSAYNRISEYLQKLTVVDSLDVEEVAPPKLRVRLTLNGQRHVLEDTLRLDKLLKQQNKMTADTDNMEVTYLP